MDSLAPVFPPVERAKACNRDFGNDICEHPGLDSGVNPGSAVELVLNSSTFVQIAQAVSS